MKNEWDIKIFTNNFDKYLRLSGKTQKEVADALAVSAPTVHDWLKGKKMPKMTNVQKLADLFGVKLSDLVESKDNNSIEYRPNRIKVYGSVPAGIPIEAVEDVIDWEDIPQTWIDYGDKYIGLKVKGDSMYPKYIDGDTVIVKLQPDCESGQDAIVYVNSYDATLKRVIKQQDGIMLQPINPEFEPKKYDYNDEVNPVSIVGIVVEIRRKI